jgi:flagellar FliJ protein
MAQFIFSLQAVLEHRIRLEEEIQKVVAAVHVRLDECQGAMERLDQNRRRTTTEMYQRLASGMPDHERVIYANYVQTLALELERLGRLEVKIQAELAKVRKALVEAMRRREIIEEVKKAEYKEYIRAEGLEERKLFDDLAQRSWRLVGKENLAAQTED